jgi:hypothetical protein
MLGTRICDVVKSMAGKRGPASSCEGKKQKRTVTILYHKLLVIAELDFKFLALSFWREAKKQYICMYKLASGVHTLGLGYLA